jgi:hypothetical protein
MIGAAELGKRSVAEQTRLLDQLDLRSVVIAELVPLIADLMRDFPIITSTTAPPVVFRARKKKLAVTGAELIANIEFPYEGVRELWYPPVASIKTYGRLNEPHEAIFYCSHTLEAAILETRPTVGDVVSVIECGLKEGATPVLRDWGLLEYAHSQHPSSPMDLTRQAFLAEHADEQEYLAVNAFLCRHFTRVVAKGSEVEYKIAIAVGKRLFADMTRTFGPDTGRNILTCDGITYESIVCNRGLNLALKPHSADRLYEPRNCQMYVVNRHHGPNHIGIRAVNESVLITEDLRIQWRY